MKRFTWVVLTNCPPGRDKEFNDWYDNVHIPDLLRIPGIIAASRSRLSNNQMSMVGDELFLTDPESIDAKYQFLACYYIETDDIHAVLEEVKQRSGTEDMELSEDLIDVYTLMYEDIH